MLACWILVALVALALFVLSFRWYPRVKVRERSIDSIFHTRAVDDPSVIKLVTYDDFECRCAADHVAYPHAGYALSIDEVLA